jgi:hypothetical protein
MTQPAKLTFNFDEKYSYKYNEILKKHKGKFDDKTKVWSLPIENKARFLSDKMVVDNKIKEHTQKIWKQACKQCGFDFVKKETQEYDQVKEVFKELIREPIY